MADPINLDTTTPVAETVGTIVSDGNATRNAIANVATPVPTAYEAPTVDPLKDAKGYQDDTTSVAGQLNKILSTDSAYMQQAAAKSRMTANELGMLSSDRYIGAAQGAAIREALPIATSDANTSAKFAQQQQIGENTISNTLAEGEVSGALKIQEAGIQAGLKKTQGAIDSLLATGAAKNSAELAGLNSRLTTASSEALKNLESQLNKDYLTTDYNEKTQENVRSEAVKLITNTMIGIENTLKSPDILQLGPEAMGSLINNQIAMMKGGVELIYNVAGLNIDGFVSDLLADYETNYTWDIPEPPPPTPPPTTPPPTGGA